MNNLFAGGSAWALIMGTDAISKMILLALFLVSIWSVSIILAKWISLTAERRRAQLLARATRNAKTLGDLAIVESQLQKSLALQLLTEAKSCRTGMPQGEIELLLEGSIDELLHQAEHALPVLSISGAVAPLVGLFGTVWGLIHAFMSISQEQTADITVVAPGIAEALLTTLAGLMVAIPALIFFHYFAGQIRVLEHYFMLSASRLAQLAGSR